MTPEELCQFLIDPKNYKYSHSVPYENGGDGIRECRYCGEYNGTEDGREDNKPWTHRKNCPVKLAEKALKGESEPYEAYLLCNPESEYREYYAHADFTATRMIVIACEESIKQNATLYLYNTMINDNDDKEDRAIMPFALFFAGRIYKN